VLRSGATVGDTVAIAGEMGASAAALGLLFERAIDADGQPDVVLAERIRHLTAAQLAPSPPIYAGRQAALAGATAMLDVSDGLALDARRIASASGVRIDFEASRLGGDVNLALAGGEDHALLACFPGALPSSFRAIGRVLAGEGVTVDGEAYERRGGWDPYEDWTGRAG
jgi:thiamine-monophosphate kinase